MRSPRAPEPAATEPSFAEASRATAQGSKGEPAGEDAAREEILSWANDTGESYFVPALEIVAFNGLLNLFDRTFIDEDEYGSDWELIKDNLGSGSVIDSDGFSTNQFQHPYSGSIYHTFARSAGLSYWTSLLYDLGGSAMWEIAGETTLPSTNDLINTVAGGSFLGEALFRMSSLIVEEGGGDPHWTREVGAAAVAPAAAFNRHVFGDRFHDVFPSYVPAISTTTRVGGSLDTEFESDAGSRSSSDFEAFADFHIEYGLPGKPGYDYDRPFDYFQFEAAGTTSKDAIIETVISRGLLVGEDYGAGDYRGVWGLFGSYDYVAPRVFRVSTTALNLGTAGQWWITDGLSFQGTGLVGAGYGAAGNVNQGTDERDFHYGVTPQAILGARLIFGDFMALDLTGGEYYVSDVASDGGDGSENIARAEASVTFRLFGRHGVGLDYAASWRDARYTDLPDRDQSVGIVSVFYAYLSDDKLGAMPHPK